MKLEENFTFVYLVSSEINRHYLLSLNCYLKVEQGNWNKFWQINFHQILKSTLAWVVTAIKTKDRTTDFDLLPMLPPETPDFHDLRFDIVFR